MTRPVFRFAPSPNGYLHLGHALSALRNFDLARAAGGRFLLRIEDIDAARCRPDYEQAIYDDLAWLGITWEQPVRRQSAHFDEYGAALARLDAMGLVYPSFESRGEIARLVPCAMRTRPGRAIPTARRFIPAMRARSRPRNAGGGWRPAIPMRCASIWRRRSRAPAR
jgi:glutamyl/glutaminyl-tRNA synthetase